MPRQIFLQPVGFLSILLTFSMATGDMILGPSSLFPLPENAKGNGEYIADRLSLLEQVAKENPKLIKKPILETFEVSKHVTPGRILTCRGIEEMVNSSLLMRAQLIQSIGQTLEFYSAHLESLDMMDYAFGLAVLKGFDDKHGKQFQSRYPLSEWTSQICRQVPQEVPQVCNAMATALEKRYNHWIHWLPQGNLESLDDYKLGVVGNDKESTKALLTGGECQVNVLTKCETSDMCKRVWYDPVPSTQYMLTHQLLLRIFTQIGTESCSFPSRFLDAQVNRKFCSKLLQEAHLISYYEAPLIFRDMFAEYVGFCGYIGYTEFFREDWLNMIMSWQSKSEYGCFVTQKDTDEIRSNLYSSHMILRRKTTKSEEEKGIKSDEICELHFTSASLAALAGAWGYFEDNCY